MLTPRIGLSDVFGDGWWWLVMVGDGWWWFLMVGDGVDDDESDIIYRSKRDRRNGMSRSKSGNRRKQGQKRCRSSSKPLFEWFVFIGNISEQLIKVCAKNIRHMRDNGIISFPPISIFPVIWYNEPISTVSSPKYCRAFNNGPFVSPRKISDICGNTVTNLLYAIYRCNYY